MPSIPCLCNLDTVPGFFFFPEVLGHQQIVGYQIPPFRLILETSICNHIHFPKLPKSQIYILHFFLLQHVEPAEDDVWRAGQPRRRKLLRGTRGDEVGR